MTESNPPRKTGYLKMRPKDTLTDPQQVIAHLDKVIIAIKDMGKSTGETALEADTVLDAWKLANAIRNTLSNSLLRIQALKGDITPGGLQAKEIDTESLAAIPQQTDELFRRIGKILEDSQNIREDLLEAKKVMPGIDHVDTGRINKFTFESTDDPEQDQKTHGLFIADSNLHDAAFRLQAAVEGGTYEVVDGVHKHVAGYIDLAASIKAVATELGPKMA